MREAAWRGRGSAAPHLMPMRPSYRRHSPPAKWPPGPMLPQARGWSALASSRGGWHPAAGSSSSHHTDPRGKGSPGSHHGGPECAPDAWRAAILARALLAVPRRWACNVPTVFTPALLTGKITICFSFMRQCTLPGACSWPWRRLRPRHGFPLR